MGLSKKEIEVLEKFCGSAWKTWRDLLKDLWNDIDRPLIDLWTTQEEKEILRNLRNKPEFHLLKCGVYCESSTGGYNWV